MVSELVIGLMLAATPARPKLLMLDVQPLGGASPALAQALTEAVVSEVTARAYFEVLASRDVTNLLGVERQKALMGGCGEDSTSCVAELTGALGAQHVLAGSISKFGDALQLNLQLLDSQKGQVVHRSTRLAKDESSLRLQLVYVVAEVTGSPLPPPPSKVLPISLISVGAGAFVVSAALGIFTLSSEAATNAELRQGQDFPQVLKSYAYYQDLQRRTSLFRTVTLVGLFTGAGLIAAGVVLYPPDVLTSSSLKVALLPQLDGFAIAGSF